MAEAKAVAAKEEWGKATSSAEDFQNQNKQTQILMNM